jgi:thiol-disulfide isomerase/thioredoxin
MAVMNHRPARAVVAGVLTVLGLTAGCTGSHAVSQDVDGSNGFQAGDASTRWVTSGDRDQVQGVTGPLLDGSEFDLASWRGHVVVVNFWGSWCGPCHDEAKALEQVYRDSAGQGVEFVGIDVRDDQASARNFVRTKHVTYPTVFDASNLLALRFRGVPPNATPTTIVLDRQGRIAARHSGAILYTQLRAVVARALAERT